MTKSDLKPFYLVKLRNGSYYLVVQDKDDELFLIKEGGMWYGLSNYYNDLMYVYNSDHDIVSVYGRAEYRSDALRNDTSYRPLLWQRQEPKKMTLKQIQEALGYEVEIVEE